jgi:hypothetical protein
MEVFLELILFLVFDVFDEKFHQVLWKKVGLILNVLYTFLIFSSCIYSFSEVYEDLSLVMECAFTVALNIETFIRMSALYFYSKDFQWMMGLILKDNPVDPRSKNIMIKHEKMIRVIIFLTIAMYTGSTILFALRSVFSTEVHPMIFYVHMFGTKYGIFI